MKKKKILVTGSAGFIGFHLVKKLCKLEYEVVGLDNINNYYDPELKYGRLEASGIDKTEVAYNRLIKSRLHKKYSFIKLDLEDKANLFTLIAREKFTHICNLAAQAGVRYSLENPDVYIQSNVVGFLNLLEGCRHFGISHLVYASSSSVYGLNEKMPFSTSDNVDHPISLYAATKKSNELMAHTYSHLFGIPTTGLRFFTVYGPWGRPDMAYFLFARAIKEGKPIKVFNKGKMKRDFTYVDDIVEGVAKVIEEIPTNNIYWTGLQPNPRSSSAPYRIFNIGNNKPIELMEFIETIEDAMKIKAEKTMMPIQAGDVEVTYADIDELASQVGFRPSTDLRTGIGHFVEWYNKYNGVD